MFLKFIHSFIHSEIGIVLSLFKDLSHFEPRCSSKIIILLKTFIHPGITGIILGESWFMFVLNPSDWNDEKLPPLNPPDEWNFHIPCRLPSIQGGSKVDTQKIFKAIGPL